MGYSSNIDIMAAQNSAGIQTLLDAEREAQKIVQKAREYRTKRVKDARSEAQKEIDEYKASKDKEFKAFEEKHSSGNKKMGKEKGSKVVDDLLKAVTQVQPVAPNKS